MSILCTFIPLGGMVRRTAYYLDLPLDKISVGDHLSDRVFDLEPSVHLHKVKLLLGIHDEFDGSWRVRLNMFNKSECPLMFYYNHRHIKQKKNLF